MKRIKNILIALITVATILSLAFETVLAPRLEVNKSGFTIARGPAPDDGDSYNAYWHNDRTGVYMVSFFDSSVYETLYLIRWFASTDSAVAHLDLDWAGRDTLSYREYPIELQSTIIE